MFTHKIISKEFENGVLVLGVEFTDGVTIVTEAIKPQDEDALKNWLQSRLDALNSLTALNVIAINDVVDTTLTPKPDKRTLEEKAFAVWSKRLEKLKAAQELVDLGVAAAVPKRDNLLNKVQTDYLPAYLD